MASHDHQEIERKYEVGPDLAVPDLALVAGVSGTVEEHDVLQVATYHDTDDLRLLSAGITLRRRTGGVDDGWHLKIPVGRDSRVEVQVPAAADDAVPEELLDRVRGDVRGRRVSPVMGLSTRRTVHRLTGKDGSVVAELCDDRVTAETRSGAPTVERWREWELELVSGSPALLDAAEPLLLEMGARRTTYATKIERVLSDRLIASRAWRERPGLGSRPSAVDVLTHYLARHLLRLEKHDRRLRSGDEGCIHQFRIATRRIRSALAAYAPLVEAEPTQRLQGELGWLGGVLGEARDTQVQQQHLLAVLADQPADLVIGLVPELIDQELTGRYAEGRRHAEDALTSDRYYRLRDDLEGYVSSPPATGTAQEPALEVVPPLLDAVLERLWSRHRRFEAATDFTEREAALHGVRRAAKRLRYAAESARPVFGARARKLAGQAEALQVLLGEVQDSVVARQLLLDLAERAHARGDGCFTLGRLHMLEEQRARDLREHYPSLLSKLPTHELDRWLRDGVVDPQPGVARTVGLG